ncbi:orotidine-5'-phosphate decarboxylase [Aestuariimicrobium ganziense]|uniref:orotidine-5'-phosphate decarboxylase n=1 Tax=Aestuariimicrobium ganziense TaxID=2773677 RepID=UPI001941E3CB|nr:orotidine-5'-phosphate decarboxylase [Aestuariimicrobium ganziense]
MTSSYRDRLTRLVADRGALCVGLDPQPSVLQAWDLPHDLRSVELCARRTVEALGDKVAVFKPQSAFYEVFGSGGIAVLEQVLRDIRDAGALSILDVKRGDIGSTMAGYAQAYLSPDAPLSVDAITISPYLGYESLRPALDLAAEHGRGVHVLARTSNPEGAAVQLAKGERGTVAQAVVDQAEADNRRFGVGHVGLVVGGTHADLKIDLAGFSGAILVPGIGAQGGSIADLAARFGNVEGVVLPSASREVLLGGPTVNGLVQRLNGLAAHHA